MFSTYRFQPTMMLTFIMHLWTFQCSLKSNDRVNITPQELHASCCTLVEIFSTSTYQPNLMLTVDLCILEFWPWGYDLDYGKAIFENGYSNIDWILCIIDLQSLYLDIERCSCQFSICIKASCLKMDIVTHHWHISLCNMVYLSILNLELGKTVSAFY